MTDLVHVRFVGAPVPLMLRATQHQQELIREFTLIQLSDERDKGDVPERLLEVIERQRAEFAHLSFRRPDELAGAIERGDPLVDIEIDLPREARAAAVEVQALLVEADDFCRHGDLITLAAAPDVVQFRAWFLGEIVRQLDGQPPTPYPGGTAPEA
ncbi:MAG TPA: hypothetical protein VEP49_17240 [Acidimicrobiia bacterium]|nr:hypothetical protein [Acidimicrobiia bacterium]